MHKKSKYDIKEYALGNYPINEKFQIYFPFDGVYEVIIKPILNESADIPVLKPITTEVKKMWSLEQYENHEMKKYMSELDEDDIILHKIENLVSDIQWFYREYGIYKGEFYKRIRSQKAKELKELLNKAKE
jgi:hypothetical protein